MPTKKKLKVATRNNSRMARSKTSRIASGADLDTYTMGAPRWVPHKGFKLSPYMIEQNQKWQEGVHPTARKNIQAKITEDVRARTKAKKKTIKKKKN